MKDKFLLGKDIRKKKWEILKHLIENLSDEEITSYGEQLLDQTLNELEAVEKGERK